jgi:hypothetical protein
MDVLDGDSDSEPESGDSDMESEDAPLVAGSLDGSYSCVPLINLSSKAARSILSDKPIAPPTKTSHSQPKPKDLEEDDDCWDW